LLTDLLVTHPIVEKPEMDPNPLYAFSSRHKENIMTGNALESYFDTIRDKLNLKTLRDCQKQALAALRRSAKMRPSQPI